MSTLPFRFRVPMAFLGALVLLITVVADHRGATTTEAANQYMTKPVKGTFQVTQEFGVAQSIGGTHIGMDIAPRSADAWYIYAPSNGVVHKALYDPNKKRIWPNCPAAGDPGNYVVLRIEPGD